MFTRILLTLLLAGCGQMERNPETLVLVQWGGSTNLDPAAFVHTGDLMIISEVYERLVSEIMPEGNPSGTFEGELAESWLVSEDGRTLTFHLYNNHFFDDGGRVDAQAVKWSFERLKEVNRVAAQRLAWIDEVEVIDDLTIRLQSKEPFAAALTSLAYTSSVVMNPATASQFNTSVEFNQWMSEHSAGSGPYRIKSWQRGERLVLKPNPHFHDQLPYFKKVVIKNLPDPSARRIQLRKGDVDFTQTIASTNAHYYESLNGIKLYNYPTQIQPGLWVVNTRKPALADARVRQAIAYGINYEGLIEGVLDGKAQRLNSLMPRGVVGFVPDLLNYNYDPQRARELLTEAGYPDGLDLRLLIGVLGPVAETLQSFMADIGIRLSLEIVASATFFDRISSGDFDIAHTSDFMDFLDPWAILRPLYHSSAIDNATNMAFYSNPEVDRLLDIGDTAILPADRSRAYAQAQTIIANEIPYIYLFSGNLIFAARDEIKGIDVSPSLGYRLNIHKMYRDSVE